MNPSGVKASNKIIDKNIAVIVKFLTFFNFFAPSVQLFDLTLNLILLISQDYMTISILIKNLQ